MRTTVNKYPAHRRRSAVPGIDRSAHDSSQSRARARRRHHADHFARDRHETSHLLVIQIAVAILTLQAIAINRLAGIDYLVWALRDGHR
jgi:hypothetical protein